MCLRNGRPELCDLVKVRERSPRGLRGLRWNLSEKRGVMFEQAVHAIEATLPASLGVQVGAADKETPNAVLRSERFVRLKPTLAPARVCV